MNPVESADAAFITEAGLEAMTSIPRGTWRNRRSARQGPPFYKAGGRVLYKKSEVLTWIEAGKIATENQT